MPFRLDPNVYGEFRGKIQFVTSAEMPSLVYRACLATGTMSNTVYIQHAVCEALSRDLGIPLGDLIDNLPKGRTRLRESAGHVPVVGDQTGGVTRVGPGNTIEDVR